MQLIRSQLFRVRLTWRLCCRLVLFCGLLARIQDSLADARTVDFSKPEQTRPNTLSAPAQLTWLHAFYHDGTKGSGMPDRYKLDKVMEKLSEEPGLNYTLAEDNVFGRMPAKTGMFVDETNTHNQYDHNSSGSTVSLPPITVTANRIDDEADSTYNAHYNRRNASTATKTDTPIMDTPVNIQVVPRQVLRDQQVFRLDQALRNVSGVIASPGIEGDEVSTRGFSSAFVFRDGARLPSGDLNSIEETAHLDRIEVLKGPGAILYGQMEPGGMVNQVSKQPLAETYYELAQQFGSYDFYRTTVDAGGPLAAHPVLKYRFNLAFENASSYVDLVENHRVFIAPVLRWDASPDTRITFQLQYKDSLDPLKVSVPFIGNRPAAVPRSTNLGEPSLGNRENQVYGGFHWSHDINQDWALSHRFYASRIEQATRRIFRATVTPLDSSILERLGTDVQSQQNYYYSTLNLTGHFDTGDVPHTLLLGSDYTGQEGNLRSHNFLYRPVNVFRPTHDANRELTDGLDELSGFDAYGFYVQDQARLPFNLNILAGFRYDRVGDRTKSVLNAFDGTPPFQREVIETVEDDAITPRYGLLWKPWDELSLYGSYTENFGSSSDPSATGRPLPPETAKQWEVGLKTSLFDNQLTGSLALFDLIKQNVARPDPANPRFSVATGEVRHRGIELDISGAITPNCNLIGSYAYLDSEITKDSAQEYDVNGNLIGINNGATGNRLAGTPRHTGSLWTSCEITQGQIQGLKIGAGVVARSQNFTDQTHNELRLPGYATVNFMLGYERSIGSSMLSFQLNIDNLLDKTYFENSGSGGANYGTPRTFLGSVRVEF